MNKKVIYSSVLVFVLIGVFNLAFRIQQIEASGTIYIRADGSVEGTNKVISSDNVTYTFTDNINDSIVVERNNIVVDGDGYMLQGTGIGIGIDLSERTNVTVQNMQIHDFSYGVWLHGSYNNTISGNTIIANNNNGIRFGGSSNHNRVVGNTIADNGYGIDLSGASNHNSFSGNNITANNDHGLWLSASFGNDLVDNNITANFRQGVWLSGGSNNSVNGNTIAANGNGMRVDGSSNNSIVGNTITASIEDGISIYGSSNNSIVGNTITANGMEGIHLVLSSSNNSIIDNNIADNTRAGIQLYPSCNHNNIIGNNITNNTYGIYLYEASDNIIHHNTFIGNHPRQAYDVSWDSGASPSVNVWDDDYPSGGNYWSDYTERYPDAEELDDSGIWNTPYVIDESNQDNYPIIPEFPSAMILPLFIVLSILTVVFARKEIIRN